MAKDPGSEIQDPRAGGAVVPDGRETGAVALAEGRQWFGHPRGLSTLFFTEMWERFSYYGMRAILVLFMTAVATGPNAGMGLQVGTAAAIYGLYTFFVYVLSLPGGWVADNIWGQKKSVFVGGVIIMFGHVALAIPTDPTFYLGLALVVVGTGLLKPNVSTMVGDLYPEGGARRDAGFSIFYMGINIGAFFGTLLVGYVGESHNFHWGFSLAAVGMFLGLVQYRLGWNHLGTAGDLATDDPPARVAQKSRNFYLASAAFTAVVLLLAFLITSGVLNISIQALASVLGTSVALLAIVYFTYLILGTRWIAPFVLLAALGTGAATQFLDREAFVGPARESLVGDARKDLLLQRQAEMRADLEAGRITSEISDEKLESLITEQEVTAIVTEERVQERASLDFFLRAYQYGIGLMLVVFLFLNVVRFARPSVQTDIDHQRLFVIFWLFILSALFWMGFEQAGSSLNIFARDLTNRSYGDWVMPASWFQNVNPFFIVTLAPIFGWLWVWLSRRNANPSIPFKFALGLFGLAVGFFVLAWGAANASPENPVGPQWLIVTYFFHTAGELCLSPVGLSSMTKLAPRGRVGQMMGIWFIAAALGNLFAGITAGQLETLAPSALFSNVAFIAGGAGVVALLASPFVKRLMGDIE